MVQEYRVQSGVHRKELVANKVDTDGKALKGATFELFKKVMVEGKETWVSKGQIAGTDESTFAWTGIDDGDYKIVEVEAPAGYNKIADQEFTVTAEHDTTADDPKLTSLSGNAASGSVITFTADKAAGSLTSDVVNKAGATLPTTGGMGTTLFYVIGSILVVCAGVLLITKRRVSR